MSPLIIISIFFERNVSNTQKDQIEQFLLKPLYIASAHHILLSSFCLILNQGCPVLKSTGSDLRRGVTGSKICGLAHSEEVFVYVLVFLCCYVCQASQCIFCDFFIWALACEDDAVHDIVTLIFHQKVLTRIWD